MNDRVHLRQSFLARAGWAGAEVRPLAADASFRTYARLSMGEDTAVLMDAPPPKENVAPFHRVQELLLKLGFSAPKPLAIDVEAGFVLLEDFGDRTFTRALDAGTDERGLYELATDLLIALHQRAPENAEGLPPYDVTRLEQEALLLPDWYLEAVRGRPTLPAERQSYLEAWRKVWTGALATSRTLVLRDYHVDNLMVLAGRNGINSCGLLDFQDALCGPVTYDLVSLLQDARRDIAPKLEEEMLARYQSAFPELDQVSFRTSYLVLGVQRAAKVIGIFTRLSRRDGKHDYLRHIPRVWRILERDLEASALAPVRAWFDQAIPPRDRRRPASANPVEKRV